MDVGLLVIHVVVGLLVAAHGAQKLLGWFDGHGLDGTGRYFESLGLAPGRPLAAMAGAGELAGGLMLAAGLVTPVAAALVTATMLVAARTQHAQRGPWITGGGWEYVLTIAAVAVGLAFNGAGAWSLDAALGWHLSGLAWGLGAIGGALAGAETALAAARRPHASGSGATPLAGSAR